MEKKQSLLEDYGSKPVPKEQGKSWFGIGIVYWGIAVCLPAFLIAGMIAGPTKLGTAIGAFIFGAIILGIISILMGIIGAHTNLSTGLTARYTFGKYGANVLQIVLFFAAWGWFGVQLGFMASGFGNGGLAYVFGGKIPIWLIEIIGGTLMTLTATFGYKAIEKLSIIAIPLLLIAIIATIVSVYSKEGVSLAKVANTTGKGAMAFGAAVSVVISSFIMGSLITPDVTRYARHKKAGGFGMAFGMMVGFPVVLILGGIMVKGSGGEFDFSRVMLNNNSGIWIAFAILTIILAAWTTNDNNLYSGALSINAMFPKLKKWMITVASGAIGTLLALWGINTSKGFTSFLGLLAVIIPPAAGVIILDYYFFKGEENKFFDPKKLDEVPNIRILPFVAWIIGTAFGFIIQKTSLKLTGIVALDTIIIAGVVYTIIMLATKHKIKVQA